jgi:hypothetical protein
VGISSTQQGGSVGTYIFEGYNLFLTMSDGSQGVFPAYLWPPYNSLEDQVLVIDNSELTTEDDSSIPFEQLPANGAGPAAQNPLQAPPQSETEPPNTLSAHTLSGTVTVPAGMSLTDTFVLVCPYDAVQESDCPMTFVEPTGAYSLELPPGEYMVVAAMDADGNFELNTEDYVAHDILDINDGEARTIDFVLEPYTE